MPITIPQKTRADLGWDALCQHLSSRCHTARGAALAEALAPMDSRDDAMARQAEVSEARALSDGGEGLSFGGVSDIKGALERADKGGVLAPEDLCDVCHTLQGGARLRRHLLGREGRAPRLLGRAALIAELVEVSGPIADAFDDAGALRDSASPALRGLRQKALALAAELSRRADTLLSEGHVAPHLQDRFVTQREERYVLPVRADARSRVRGIVHGMSASGATVFVEPEEIIDLNNRLRLAQLEVADEERRILQDLSARVAEAAGRIAQNLEILAVLDLIDAAARLSSDLRASPLPLTEVGPGAERGPVDLRNARHPLLHLAGVKVVPSDILLPVEGCLVVTGPNAGGKTVALKLVGLCALMARAGLHCAVQEGSTLPLFELVLTDIGDDQSLERSLSTFSAHIMNMCAFLEQAQRVAEAGGAALVLLDEVAAGTDPDQGAALAQALLERFADLRATVIVTTHYDRLKALGPSDGRFHNASVGFDIERLQPTYRLHLGTPGASGALLVARRLGLPEAVGQRAEHLLGSRQSGLEALLQALGREREELIGERQAAEVARRSAEIREAEAQQLLDEARAEVRKARRGAHDEAVAALRKARVELEEARVAARRLAERAQPSKEELTAARQRVDALAGQVARLEPEPELPPGRAAGAGDLPLGAKVLVPRLGGVGVIVSEPERGKVIVQVGALKLNVDVGELRVPQGGQPSQRPAPRPERRPQRATQAPQVHGGGAPGADEAGPVRVRSSYATLDLRGERADAAIARAEKFLDDALHQGLGEIYLLHGHGTGALRAAIREHFHRYPGIARMYPASQAEGGDGVTVLELA